MWRFSIIALVLAAGLAAGQGAPPPRMPEDVAIFAVRSNRKAVWVDPIVIVHYGTDQRFRTIPSLNPPLPLRNVSDADFDKLENRFYTPGTLLSLFSGGRRLGSATVRRSNVDGSDGGCVDLSAEIHYAGRGVPLLAVSTTNEIPGHASTRRPATPAEASLLRRLAMEWLADYGLDRELLKGGHMSPVVSSVLREGAGRALVGRFDLATKHAIHRLFAVAERDGKGYRLTLTDLEIQRDVEDGVDKSEREYIDQLDIDNDGQDEVITSARHYESWSYGIWRFGTQSKVWGNAYSAVTGGC